MGVPWRRSGAVERDNNDVRAIAAVVEFFVGGTSTPLTVYNDAAGTTPAATDVNGNIVSDGAGRWPTIFIPFTTSYRERTRTAGGVALWDIDNIPNPDPVEASEDSVDDTQLIQTGDWTFSPVDETRTGFVRANGRTVGSASSGGTERANADCENLFLFTWNKLADAQAAVSSGRGASAAADWAANKTIAMPDVRGAVPRGLDDMGNSAASRFGNTPFTNGNATTQGSVAGLNDHILLSTQIEAHTHGLGTMAVVSDGGHTHLVSGNTGAESSHTHTGTTGAGNSHTHTGVANHTETVSTDAGVGGGGLFFGVTFSAPAQK